MRAGQASIIDCWESGFIQPDNEGPKHPPSHLQLFLSPSPGFPFPSTLSPSQAFPLNSNLLITLSLPSLLTLPYPLLPPPPIPSIFVYFFFDKYKMKSLFTIGISINLPSFDVS